MLEDDLTVCGICRKELTSDETIHTKAVRYCKMCGERIAGLEKFCCTKCEGAFKRFMKEKKARKWKKQMRINPS